MTRFRIPHLKTILLVIGSLVVVGGISLGTLAILQQLKPTVPGSKATNSAVPQATGPDADRLRAEQLLQKGKLTEAKTAYESALSGYTSAGNKPAEADIKAQIAMIDAQLKSLAGAKQVTSAPHQSGAVK